MPGIGHSNFSSAMTCDHLTIQEVADAFENLQTSLRCSTKPNSPEEPQCDKRRLRQYPDNVR
jgi:hypothetical protein